MGVQDLQSFLEGPQVAGGSVPVDLLRIARGLAQGQAHQQHRGGRSGASQNAASNKLSLVVDGECCLDRLYGGYFSGMDFYFCSNDNICVCVYIYIWGGFAECFHVTLSYL
jgi:hypothetical protein